MERALELAKPVAVAPTSNTAAPGGTVQTDAAAVAMHRLGDILAAGGLQPQGSNVVQPVPKRTVRLKQPSLFVYACEFEKSLTG